MAKQESLVEIKPHTDKIKGWKQEKLPELQPGSPTLFEMGKGTKWMLNDKVGKILGGK